MDGSELIVSLVFRKRSLDICSREENALLKLGFAGKDHC